MNEYTRTAPGTNQENVEGEVSADDDERNVVHADVA